MSGHLLGIHFKTTIRAGALGSWKGSSLGSYSLPVNPLRQWGVVNATRLQEGPAIFHELMGCALQTPLTRLPAQLWVCSMGGLCSHGWVSQQGALGVPFPLEQPGSQWGRWGAPGTEQMGSRGNIRGPRVAVLPWHQLSQGSLDNFWVTKPSSKADTELRAGLLLLSQGLQQPPWGAAGMSHTEPWGHSHLHTLRNRWAQHCCPLCYTLVAPTQTPSGPRLLEGHCTCPRQHPALHERKNVLGSQGWTPGMS